MREAFQIAQILFALVLIAVILLQGRGSGFGTSGSDSSIYRTRRGFERTLFQFTIILAVGWVLISIGAAMVQ